MSHVTVSRSSPSRVHSATDHWLLFTPGPGHPAHTDPEHSALGYIALLLRPGRQTNHFAQIFINQLISFYKKEMIGRPDVFGYFEKPSSRLNQQIAEEIDRLLLIDTSKHR